MGRRVVIDVLAQHAAPEDRAAVEVHEPIAHGVRGDVLDVVEDARLEPETDSAAGEVVRASRVFGVRRRPALVTSRVRSQVAPHRAGLVAAHGEEPTPGDIRHDVRLEEEVRRVRGDAVRGAPLHDSADDLHRLFDE